MTEHAYYLISDIHLERKNVFKKNFLLESINLVIEDNNKKNIQTVIVFSGDVDNGIVGYDWLKKIQAKIVYVAGNHEFWNNDYYKTLENLKQKAPENVHFLHNDFVECGDYIFVGSTMWTDVGKTLNSSLQYVSNGIMNDNYNITAQQWYTETNIEKIKEILPNYSHKNIENHGWNILIEQEENQKTIDFFNNFSYIREQLLKLHESYKNSDRDIKREYSFLTQEQYNAIHKAIKLTEFTYKEWLMFCKKFKLLGYQEVTDKMINSVTVEQESIFKKLACIKYTKELIVVSHHLPFLEERLIGYYSHIENSEKLLNHKADNIIYTIREGLNSYPYHNYFYRISKGDFSRDESILEAVHYSNNGAVNLPRNLYEKAKAWCHGHDHTLNYQDYVKGVNIVTNPLSYSLDVFKFSENGIFLNDTYKQYHKIDTPQQEIEEVEKLRKLVLKPISINQLKNKDEIIKLWVFNLMNKEKILSLLESFTQNNKKFFTYLAKNPKFSIGEVNDKQYQKIQEFTFANHYYYNELNKELEVLDLAYAARFDEDFSYMNKVNKNYSKEISQYFYERDNNIKVEDFSKESIEDYGYDYLSTQIFNNIYYLNKSVKRIKHLISLCESYGEINNITQLFNKKVPDLLPKEKQEDFLFDRQLYQKKKDIMNKYTTVEVENIKEERNKDKYDF